MSTYDGFLQAILDEPEDNSHRLIFADWLEDQGQSERAELIRIQITLWMLDNGFDLNSPELPIPVVASRSSSSKKSAPTPVTLRRRQNALLKAHGEQWRKDLPSWARKKAEFRRGFVGRVDATAAGWIQKARKVRTVAPIEAVRLRSVLGSMQSLVDSGQLNGLREVQMYYNNLTPEDMLILREAGDLSSVTFLHLSHNQIGDSGLMALTQSPYLTELTELHLSINGITDSGIEHLVQWPQLALLKTLTLSQNAITSNGAVQLARSPLTSSLRSLHLDANPIDDRGVMAILQSPHLQNLRQLDISTYRLQADTITAIQQRLAQMEAASL